MRLLRLRSPEALRCTKSVASRVCLTVRIFIVSVCEVKCWLKTSRAFQKSSVLCTVESVCDDGVRVCVAAMFECTSYDAV